MRRHRQRYWTAAVLLAAATFAFAQDRPQPQSHPSSPKRSGPVHRQWRKELTPDQEKELLGLIQKRQPELRARLLEKRTTSPIAYRWEMQLLWNRYERIRHLPREIQEATLTQMQAKGTILTLVRQYRHANSDGEKLRLEKTLRKAIAEEFDAEQTLNAYRLTEMGQQLKRMRADLTRQAAAREKIIQTRLERALHHGSGDSRDDSSLPRSRGAVMSATLTGSDAPARVIFVADGNDRDGREDRRINARSRQQELTDPQEAELLTVLKEKSPAHYERLVALKRDNPQAYARFAAAMWRWYQQWKRMPADVQQPALVVMDRQVDIYRLVREYRRAATEAQRQRITAELKQAIGEHFDAELKVRAHALGVFEQRLARMQLALEAQGKRRDDIISERLKRYLAKDPKPARAPRPRKRVELPEADGG